MLGRRAVGQCAYRPQSHPKKDEKSQKDSIERKTNIPKKPKKVSREIPKKPKEKKNKKKRDKKERRPELTELTAQKEKERRTN